MPPIHLFVPVEGEGGDGLFVEHPGEAQRGSAVEALRERPSGSDSTVRPTLLVREKRANMGGGVKIMHDGRNQTRPRTPSHPSRDENLPARGGKGCSGRKIVSVLTLSMAGVHGDLKVRVGVLRDTHGRGLHGRGLGWV